jgi:hypothetical protein
MEGRRHPKVRIRATMFDLIRALQEQMKAEEESLVPLIVIHMIDTGLLKFVNKPGFLG